MHEAVEGFDHADIHAATDRLYVAHTSNDTIDVIDVAQDRYLESITECAGVAGALVSEPRGLVFTSNRVENTVSVLAPDAEWVAFKIAVGVKPNGLAFDPARGILIVGNLGDPAIADSYSVSVVGLARRERVAEIAVRGPTRWTIYDAASETFFINVSFRGQIIAIDARDPTKVARALDVPEVGPHGLDFDPATSRLLSACDSGVLDAMEPMSGRVLGTVQLSGKPDVVFLDPKSRRLFMAVGNPGASTSSRSTRSAAMRWCRQSAALIRLRSIASAGRYMRSCPNHIAPRSLSMWIDRGPRIAHPMWWPCRE